jgi:hypothetical protein
MIGVDRWRVETVGVPAHRGEPRDVRVWARNRAACCG